MNRDEVWGVHPETDSVIRWGEVEDAIAYHQRMSPILDEVMRLLNVRDIEQVLPAVNALLVGLEVMNAEIDRLRLAWEWNDDKGI